MSAAALDARSNAWDNAATSATNLDSRSNAWDSAAVSATALDARSNVWDQAADFGTNGSHTNAVFSDSTILHKKADASANVFGINTSDGSDSGETVYSAAGAAGQGRSSYARMHGTDHATAPGDLFLVVGTNATARLELYDRAGALMFTWEADGDSDAQSNKIENVKELGLAGEGTNNRIMLGTNLYIYGAGTNIHMGRLDGTNEVITPIPD